MVEFLKDRNCRILIAFGLYLFCETIDNIINSDYTLKATSDNKNIILQKQFSE